MPRQALTVSCAAAAGTTTVLTTGTTILASAWLAGLEPLKNVRPVLFNAGYSYAGIIGVFYIWKPLIPQYFANFPL